MTWAILPAKPKLCKGCKAPFSDSRNSDYCVANGCREKRRLQVKRRANVKYEARKKLARSA